MQLGTKRNWADSDDLCIMFKAAYKTEFYRAVRNALHAEVDSWKESKLPEEARIHLEYLWLNVSELEPVSRDPDVFTFSANSGVPVASAIVPVQQLTLARKG